MKVYFNNDLVVEFDNSNNLTPEEIRSTIINNDNSYRSMETADYYMESGNLYFFIQNKKLG